MASIYTISDGTGRVEISSTSSTFLATQLSAASLDADVTVKLQHSSDGVNFIDIADTSYTLTAASDTQLIETFDFTLDTCYLYVDVGSATTGQIDIFTNNKKKVDSANVTATISGTVDAELTNDELTVTEKTSSSQVVILSEILEELKINNKLLRKIYNPE